jgi:nitroimidazol reductase NimA-like FMN-containing flavoprotein (pyridoxamine 5'-phosphate oxidase superfamily)
MIGPRAIAGIPVVTGNLVCADRSIEELDEAESLRLISAGGIGRIAYASRFGPVVLPVNCK